MTPHVASDVAEYFSLQNMYFTGNIFHKNHKSPSFFLEFPLQSLWKAHFPPNVTFNLFVASFYEIQKAGN